MSFTVLTEITDQTIRDVLCCAMEGGINYWAQIEDYVGDRSAVEYAHIDLPLTEDGAVLLRDTEEEDEGKPLFRLDRAALQRGLEMLSKLTLVGNERGRKMPPRHLANIMSGEFDAETGDVLVQMALFGEIVYG